MRKPLNTSLVFGLTTHIQFLSRQKNLSFFHTNGHLIQNLQNCNDFFVAASLHSNLIKSGSLSHTFTTNHLLNCYVRLRRIDFARNLFDELSGQNVVSRTSIIAGYTETGHPCVALWLFVKTPECLVLPNEFTFSIAIIACSALSDVKGGKEIHACIEVSGLRPSLVLCSALVDLYRKCNDVDAARWVFNSMGCRDVVSWAAMITAYSQNARVHEPSGLVDEGLKHLEFMYVKRGILPGTKNHACVVDMLSRAGLIDEAYRMAKSIQADGDAAALLWGTLLSASRLVGRVDIAVEASRRLIESNQQVASAYVTLSKTYALTDDWDIIHNLRCKMKRGGVHKETACSWIEVKDSTYVFFAGDASSFEQGTELVNLLRELEKRTKERGHVGRSKGLLFVDVDDETKEEIVGFA